MKSKPPLAFIIIISQFMATQIHIFAQNKDTIPHITIAPLGGFVHDGQQYGIAPDQKDIMLKGRCVMIYMDMKKRLFMPGVCVALVCITDQTRQYAKTDSLGYYQFTLLPDKKYYVTAHKKEYGNSMKKDTISTNDIRKPATMSRDLYFWETYIYYSPILYLRNKTGIDSNDISSLDATISSLKKHPNLTIEIASFTDCQGTNHQCDSISLRRAIMVKKYMVSHGIDSSRLTARGYGKKDPMNECGCNPHKRKNKRKCKTKVKNRGFNHTEFWPMNHDYSTNNGEVFECDEQ